MKIQNYYQTWSGFDSTLHVTDADWVGITSASSYLPGNKLLLKSKSDHPKELNRENFTHIVIHGYSSKIEKFVEKLRLSKWDIPIYMVWHGSIASLHSRNERKLFNGFVNFSRNKSVRRVATLRFDQNGMLPFKCWNYPLLNAIPKTEMNVSSPRMNYLIPGWDLMHKNIWQNINIAMSASNKMNIYHYAYLDHIPTKWNYSQLIQIPYIDRDEHFHTLSKIDTVLNLSIVDCQPMVDLESLSAGCKLLKTKHAPIDKIVEHEIWDLITGHSYDEDFNLIKLKLLYEIPWENWLSLCKSFISKYNVESEKLWRTYLEL